ncbi:hypothetical protein HBP99_17270 [Listeria booriae]|uniref:hypothetical protein n=1 Tax=Listeria booriae TaxID=1552123 RepID=UPI0016286B3C|nr:hypothetical protein [Listeria booriae]MBC2370354.1 hypothetical protein [Listeria booriae]
MLKNSLLFNPNGRGSHPVTMKIMECSEGIYKIFYSSDFFEIVNEKIFTENYAQFILWLEKEIDSFLVQLNLKKTDIVVLRIHPQQLFYSETLVFLENYKKINSFFYITLSEVEISPPFFKSHLTTSELNAFILGKLAQIRNFGYKIFLDNIGHGRNHIGNAVYYLPVISGVCFYSSKFKRSNTQKIFSLAWREFSREYNKVFVSF